MDEIKQLDDVLSYLAKDDVKKSGKFFDLLFKELTNAGIDVENYHAIMDKLAHDRNIFAKVSEGGISDGMLICRITFEGMLFQKNGGYSGQADREKIELASKNAQNQRMERNEERLVKWTKYLTFGTIAIVLWEIVKTFCFEKH